MAIATIATTGFAVYKGVKGLGIGKKKKYNVGDCGEPVPSAVSEMLANLPIQERARLSASYAKANDGKKMPTNAGEIAFGAYGGRDCKITHAAGKEFKNVFDQLMDNYGPGGESITQSGTVTGGNSGRGDYVQPAAQPSIISAGGIGSNIMPYVIGAVLLFFGYTQLSGKK